MYRVGAVLGLAGIGVACWVMYFYGSVCLVSEPGTCVFPDVVGRGDAAEASPQPCCGPDGRMRLARARDDCVYFVPPACHAQLGLLNCTEPSAMSNASSLASGTRLVHRDRTQPVPADGADGGWPCHSDRVSGAYSWNPCIVAWCAGAALAVCSYVLVAVTFTSLCTWDEDVLSVSCRRDRERFCCTRRGMWVQFFVLVVAVGCAGVATAAIAAGYRVHGAPVRLQSAVLAVVGGGLNGSDAVCRVHYSWTSDVLGFGGVSKLVGGAPCPVSVPGGAWLVDLDHPSAGLTTTDPEATLAAGIALVALALVCGCFCPLLHEWRRRRSAAPGEHDYEAMVPPGGV